MDKNFRKLADVLINERKNILKNPIMSKVQNNISQQPQFSAASTSMIRSPENTKSTKFYSKKPNSGSEVLSSITK